MIKYSVKFILIILNEVNIVSNPSIRVFMTELIPNIISAFLKYLLDPVIF